MTVLRTDLGNFGSALKLTGAGALALNQAFTNDLGSGVGARGIKVKVWVNGAPGGTTPGMIVTIQGVDPTSGQKWTLLASASLNANGFTVLTVYPGATPAANVTANDSLPANVNINVAFTGTNPSYTGNISAELLP